MKRKLAVGLVLCALAFCGPASGQGSVRRDQLARLVDSTVRELGSSDRTVRASAAELLGAIGGARALVPVLDLARDPEARVRRAVAKALGGLGDPRGVPVLGRMLAEDKDSLVRSRAASALGELGDPAAAPALVAARRSSPWGGSRTLRCLTGSPRR